MWINHSRVDRTHMFKLALSGTVVICSLPLEGVIPTLPDKILREVNICSTSKWSVDVEAHCVGRHQLLSFLSQHPYLTLFSWITFLSAIRTVTTTQAKNNRKYTLDIVFIHSTVSLIFLPFYTHPHLYICSSSVSCPSRLNTHGISSSIINKHPSWLNTHKSLPCNTWNVLV